MNIITNLFKNVLWNPIYDVVKPGNRTTARMNDDVKAGEHILFDAQKDKLIVFSDLHRGIKGEKGERFKSNEGIYKNALNYYYDKGFNLVLLGDVEEGWGYWGRMGKIFDSYPEVLDLEKNFSNENRYYRVYGNHDDYWRKTRRVNKFFNGDQADAKIEAYSALTFEDNGNKIVMVHGCQGHNFQDIGDTLSRFAVHVKVDVFNIKSSKHQIDRRNKMRKQEERILNWAQGEKCMVIMGHTHTIYFKSMPKAYFEERQIKYLKDMLGKNESVADTELHQKAIEFLEEMAGVIHRQGQVSKQRGGDESPGVFNSGNCCVSGNEISGIEIADGKVRLVFWLKGAKEPQVVEYESLEKIFSAIKGKEN